MTYPVGEAKEKSLFHQAFKRFLRSFPMQNCECWTFFAWGKRTVIEVTDGYCSAPRQYWKKRTACMGGQLINQSCRIVGSECS